MGMQIRFVPLLCRRGKPHGRPQPVKRNQAERLLRFFGLCLFKYAVVFGKLHRLFGKTLPVAVALSVDVQIKDVRRGVFVEIFVVFRIIKPRGHRAVLHKGCPNVPRKRPQELSKPRRCGGIAQKGEVMEFPAV